MKKYKKHIISILLILIMLIFALSTSKGRVDASLTIINNSSQNLKIKILGHGWGDQKIDEEFTLNIGQEKIIKINGHNDYYSTNYIYKISIYNENDEILKTFGNSSENYTSDIIKVRACIITDETLK
jgi:hypothetical protein